MNHHKSIVRWIAGAALATSSLTAGAWELSANVGMQTDYLFRGVSQSENDPSVGGGFDVALDNGFYFGTYGASINWLAGAGTMEWDLYFGYGGSFNDTVSYDVGYIRYEYPGMDSAGGGGFDFQEIYASISAYGGTVGFAYSDDFWGGTGSDDDAAYYYLYGAYSYAVSDVLSIDAEVGYNDFESNNAWNDYFASSNTEVDSYVNYSIGATYTWADGDSEILSFSLTYTDTTIDADECAFTRLCDGKVVFGVSKSL